MVSLSTCLPRCELNVHIVQDVITVRAMTQMPKNLVNTHYYTLLHITAYITIIEPCLLARTLDKQVLIEANLQDTSWKGGRVHFAHQVCVTIYIYIYIYILSGLETLGPSWLEITGTMAVATLPIATTTTWPLSPMLIQAVGQETAAQGNL